ncbi:MAG: hypothetical protein WBG02_02145 [Candidatus Acidiferrum sp.]
MRSANSMSKPVLAALWGIAIGVTAIGGSWHTPTAVPPNWKFDIQFPGVFVVLYAGWFLGSLQVMMSPIVVCALTILANAFVYYALARMILFFGQRRKEA